MLTKEEKARIMSKVWTSGVPISTKEIKDYLNMKGHEQIYTFLNDQAKLDNVKKDEIENPKEGVRWSLSETGKDRLDKILSALQGKPLGNPEIKQCIGLSPNDHDDSILSLLWLLEYRWKVSYSTSDGKWSLRSP